MFRSTKRSSNKTRKHSGREFFKFAVSPLKPNLQAVPVRNPTSLPQSTLAFHISTMLALLLQNSTTFPFPLQSRSTSFPTSKPQRFLSNFSLTTIPFIISGLQRFLSHFSPTISFLISGHNASFPTSEPKCFLSHFSPITVHFLTSEPQRFPSQFSPAALTFPLQNHNVSLPTSVP